MVFHYARASIPNLCSRILTRQVAECRLLAIYVLTTLFRCSQSHDAMIAFLDRARARMHVYTILILLHDHKFGLFSTGKFVTYIIDNLRSSLKLDYRNISSRTRSFRTSKHNSNNDTIHRCRHTVREISLIFSRKRMHEITRSCMKEKTRDKKFGRKGRLTTGICARANERDHLRRL